MFLSPHGLFPFSLSPQVQLFRSQLHALLLLSLDSLTPAMSLLPSLSTLFQLKNPDSSALMGHCQF